MKTEISTVATLKKDFSTLLQKELSKSAPNRHAKIRFKTVLRYLETVDNNKQLRVRKTVTNWNAGDIVESIIKMKINNSQIEGYASPFEKDLEKETYNEIKALVNSNSYPNGWLSTKEMQGVLVAMQDKKVYYIKKSLIVQHQDQMRHTEKNGYQLTNKLVKDIIANYHLKPHYITELLNWLDRA